MFRELLDEDQMEPKVSEQGQDLVSKARALVMELGQERKSALCKAVTHKVIERRAQEAISALCDELVALRDERDSFYTTAMVAASESEQSEVQQIRECDKCDLCEDHHG